MSIKSKTRTERSSVGSHRSKVSIRAFDGPAELCSARFSSKIEIKDKKAVLKAYYDALVPEADFKTGRAGYKLKLGKDKLTIEIAAKDATAFRAITNSLAGLMSIVSKTLKFSMPR